MYCEGLPNSPTRNGRYKLRYMYDSSPLSNTVFLLGHFHDFVAWQLHYTE